MYSSTRTTIPPNFPQVWEKGLMTLTSSLIIIIALLGNLLVVLVFSTYKPLRKIANSFIVSLAVSDMLVGGINMPTWIIGFVWDYPYSELVSATHYV